MPNDYLASDNKVASETAINNSELKVEFMLNALRLTQGFSLQLFEQTTGRPMDVIATELRYLADRELIDETSWEQRAWLLPTDKGRLFVDDMVACFMDG